MKNSNFFSLFTLHNSGAVYQVYDEDEGDNTATKLFGSILNALVFLAIIIAVTVLFVILYKYRCLKVYHLPFVIVIVVVFAVVMVMVVVGVFTLFKYSLHGV